MHYPQSILSPRFPKKVKVTYTTETDDESKQVEVDIEEDEMIRIIFLERSCCKQCYLNYQALI